MCPLSFRVPVSTIFGKKNCRRKRALSKKRTTRSAIKHASGFVPSPLDRLDQPFGDNSLHHRLLVDVNGNNINSNLGRNSLSFVQSMKTQYQLSHHPRKKSQSMTMIVHMITIMKVIIILMTQKMKKKIVMISVTSLETNQKLKIL